MLQDFIVAVGYIYTDGLYAIIVIHVYCAYDILIQLLDELDNAIRETGAEKSTIRKKLITLVQKHQELLRFAFFESLMYAPC